jgi:hypothetical protein
MDGEVSQWAQHFQTILQDGGQMGTSGDEAYIKTGLGQSSPKIISGWHLRP